MTNNELRDAEAALDHIGALLELPIGSALESALVCELTEIRSQLVASIAKDEARPRAVPYLRLVPSPAPKTRKTRKAK